MLLRILLFILVFSFSIRANAQFKSKTEKANQVLDNAIEAIDELTSQEDNDIPKELLRKMEGMVIFPGALKVALGFGGQGGRGFAMLKKKDGQWSNPYFLGMGEGSVGAQIGVQSSDIVLLFKNRKDIERLENTELTLGGDVGIAAGPVGRNSSASTDIGFDAEIYSYSRSKGLYAGISLEGTVLEGNQKMNDEYYSKTNINAKDVFYNVKTPYSTEIRNFMNALKSSSE
ncbi:MAG: lipid-binding SYLF domain-containing protein [Bacteroidota bacterium]